MENNKELTNVKERQAKDRTSRKDNTSSEQKKEYQEELISIDKVTRVTAGGRQLRFRAIMVIGDGKGTIGIGTGKSGEVVEAIAKAIANARKNLVKVPLENGTVPHDIKVKYSSAVVMLHPANKGTGLIAGGAMRKVLAVAGYKDILAKRYGARNLLNNARATLKALQSMKK